MIGTGSSIKPRNACIVLSVKYLLGTFESKWYVKRPPWFCETPRLLGEWFYHTFKMKDGSPKPRKRGNADRRTWIERWHGGSGPSLHSTLPETNVAPENGPSQKESSLPTIHFQVLCYFHNLFSIKSLRSILTRWLDSSQASRQKCPAPPLSMQGNSSSSSVDEVMLQRWNGSVWLDLQEHQGGNCQPTRAVEEFEESQPLGIMIFWACKWLRTIGSTIS